jgi:hypothetical protein
MTPILKISRLLLPALTILCLQSAAQISPDQAKMHQYNHLKTLINSKKFRFHALSANPRKGGNIQLSGEYSLKINGNNLEADLPYYGRAFTVDYPATSNSIQFTSHPFSYVADTTKKGGWEITIIPKNAAKVNKIYMSITTSGYCTTRVTSNARDPISFYGTITDYNTR